MGRGIVVSGLLTFPDCALSGCTVSAAGFKRSEATFHVHRGSVWQALSQSTELL